MRRPSETDAPRAAGLRRGLGPAPLPGPIAALIAGNRKGRFRQSSCLRCPSSCCSRGGFAVLGNVFAIYNLYLEGGLRSIRALGPGLGFRGLVTVLFDVWIRRTGPEGRGGEFAAFHARSVAADGTPIPVPPEGDYWDARERLFARNPGLNRGCAFLSEMLPEEGIDDGKPRRCLLHGRLSATHLTAKPIDCVYYNCRNPGPGRLPSLKAKHRWFGAIARCWPGTAEELEELMGAGRLRGR